MEEILHQLVCSLSMFIPLFTRLYTSQRVVRDFFRLQCVHVFHFGRSEKMCLPMEQNGGCLWVSVAALVFTSWFRSKVNFAWLLMRMTERKMNKQLIHWFTKRYLSIFLVQCCPCRFFLGGIVFQSFAAKNMVTFTSFVVSDQKVSSPSLYRRCVK